MKDKEGVHIAGKGYCLRCDLETQPEMKCKCSFRKDKEVEEILDRLAEFAVDEMKGDGNSLLITELIGRVKKELESYGSKREQRGIQKAVEVMSVYMTTEELKKINETLDLARNIKE